MLWEILKASKGILVADFYADLWANIAGGGTPVDVFVEMIGTLPLYYDGKGIDLADYLISGNTVQDGTPSADAPVDAVGSGVRTGNVFDFEKLKTAPSATIGYVTFPHVLTLQLEPNTYYTMASNGTGSTNSTPVELYRSVYFNSSVGESSVNKNNPVTVLTDGTGVVKIGFFSDRANAQQYLNGEAQLWIIKSSTALPYEPYGYKLPLTVNSVEYPIYLGTVPTTRRIKKLVLTGEEGFSAPYGNSIFYVFSSGIGIAAHIAYEVLCTHFARSETNAAMQMADNKILLSSTSLYIRMDAATTLADFKSYLAAQYAAGTPVTVWYVLAEPETAIVNEPLMKIGDYADTVSFAQAGVTIPTANGANVLDMTSPVKPSEVYIKGKGIKPTGYGQLTDVNGVNILDKDGRPINVHGQ